MSDPRGSGFDPYAYLHDTDEHTTSYLPPEQETSSEAPVTPPAPAAAAPATPASATSSSPGTSPSSSRGATPQPAHPGVDLETDLPPTMTRRQLREARERAAKQREQSAERDSATTQSLSAAALVAEQTPAEAVPPTQAGPSASWSGAGTLSGTAVAAGTDVSSGAPPAPYAASPDPYAPVDAWGSGGGPTTPGSTLPPGDKPPSGRSRLLVLLGVLVGVAALAALVVFIVLPLLRGDSREAPSGPPTASGETEGRSSPLLDLLPTTVTGGQFAVPTEEPTEEPTEGGTSDGTEPTGDASEDATPEGTAYRLVQNGYVDNTQPPDGALESVVGQFSGGAELVTLTASRFGTSEEALAAATAKAGTLGAVVEEGVVFPEEDLGYYWIFNTDGLVTIVWTDGDLGAYWIVSEDAVSALEFYYGLEF